MHIIADTHLHSSFSNDSDTPMEAMIQQGIKKGLRIMCFTEHQDEDFPDTPGYPALPNNLVETDSYLYDILRFREKYQDQITLLFGIELGLQPHVADFNTNYAKSYPFDFIIGSSHVCQGMNPYYPLFFADKTDETAYRLYFESILQNLLVFDDFDVYGHLDYIVRYGKNPNLYYDSLHQYSDLVDQILRHLIERGKGIEINTGGVKKGLLELHPATIWLRRYKELGGEIVTIGSDSHFPGGIAAHFDRAGELLSSLGFRYYTVFVERKPHFMPLIT